MVFNTVVKSETTKVVQTVRSSNGGGIIQSLLSVNIEHEVRLKDVLAELKASGYMVKPMRLLLEKAETPAEQDEALLEGFFKNLASTSSFCNYRIALLAYNDAHDEHFLLKGAQVNCVVFKPGKYIKGDGTAPSEKTKKVVKEVEEKVEEKDEESEE